MRELQTTGICFGPNKLHSRVPNLISLTDLVLDHPMLSTIESSESSLRYCDDIFKELATYTSQVSQRVASMANTVLSITRKHHLSRLSTAISLRKIYACNEKVKLVTSTQELRPYGLTSQDARDSRTPLC
jgi:hypothetical protein